MSRCETQIDLDEPTILKTSETGIDIELKDGFENFIERIERSRKLLFPRSPELIFDSDESRIKLDEDPLPKDYLDPNDGLEPIDGLKLNDSFDTKEGPKLDYGFKSNENPGVIPDNYLNCYSGEKVLCFGPKRLLMMKRKV